MQTQYIMRMPWKVGGATAALPAGHDAPKTWIQIAETGQWTSNRYGEFGLSRENLATMVKNFRDVSGGKDRVPCDYDHLGSNPRQPGDAAAAGWLQQVELRKNGDELWALCEWTPPAVTRLRNREYRYISPSFSSDYTTNTGEKVGHVLLGCALTNQPFLTGMAEVVLAADRTMFGALAIPSAAPISLAASPAEAPKNLPVALPRTLPVKAAAPAADGGARLPASGAADPYDRVGRTVVFDPLDTHTVSELSPEEKTAVYRIVGVHQGVFCQLVKASDGTPFGWYQEDSLAPAPATAPNTAITEGPDGTTPGPENLPIIEDDQMDVPTPPKAARKLAARFAASVAALVADGKSPRDAVLTCAANDFAGANAYRLHADALTPEPSSAVSLSAGTRATFDDLVRAHAKATGVTLAMAVRQMAQAHPKLAADR